MIVPGAQFFAAGGRQLFGVFSPARGRADAAVLLCPPMLHEQVRSHRLWALLADALAGQGISVLRFDYAGSGDAEGDSRLLDVGEALNDAEYALAELRAATNALPVHVLGVRLGGFVAAAQAGAGDELHLGVRVIQHAVRAHIQAQPLNAGLQLQPGRARAGVPGGLQIGGIAAHEGGVARSHQRLGIGRGRVGKVFDIAAAAREVRRAGRATAAGADGAVCGACHAATVRG